MSARGRLPSFAPTALWHESFDPYTADWKSKDRSIWMGEGDRFVGMTLGDVQQSWWSTYERGAIASDGSPCGPRTAGIVEPAPTIVSGVCLIGRESRRLGLGRDVISQPEYLALGGDDEAWTVLEGARALLHHYGALDRLVGTTGLSGSWFEHLGDDDAATRWRAKTSLALKAAVATEARRALKTAAPFDPTPADDLDAIRAFLDLPVPERRCRACGTLLSDRITMWCSEGCRARARRQAAASPPVQLRLDV
jgi:hypothetical protein